MTDSEDWLKNPLNVGGSLQSITNGAKKFAEEHKIDPNLATVGVQVVGAGLIGGLLMLAYEPVSALGKGLMSLVRMPLGLLEKVPGIGVVAAGLGGAVEGVTAFFAPALAAVAAYLTYKSLEPSPVQPGGEYTQPSLLVIPTKTGSRDNSAMEESKGKDKNNKGNEKQNKNDETKNERNESKEKNEPAKEESGKAKKETNKAKDAAPEQPKIETSKNDAGGSEKPRVSEPVKSSDGLTFEGPQRIIIHEPTDIADITKPQAPAQPETATVADAPAASTAAPAEATASASAAASSVGKGKAPANTRWNGLKAAAWNQTVGQWIRDWNIVRSQFEKHSSQTQQAAAPETPQATQPQAPATAETPNNARTPATETPQAAPTQASTPAETASPTETASVTGKPISKPKITAAGALRGFFNHSLAGTMHTLFLGTGLDGMRKYGLWDPKSDAEVAVGGTGLANQLITRPLFTAVDLLGKWRHGPEFKTFDLPGKGTRVAGGLSRAVGAGGGGLITVDAVQRLYKNNMHGDQDAFKNLHGGIDAAGGSLMVATAVAPESAALGAAGSYVALPAMVGAYAYSHHYEKVMAEAKEMAQGQQKWLTTVRPGLTQELTIAHQNNIEALNAGRTADVKMISPTCIPDLAKMLDVANSLVLNTQDPEKRVALWKKYYTERENEQFIAQSPEKIKDILAFVDETLSYRIHDNITNPKKLNLQIDPYTFSFYGLLHKEENYVDREVYKKLKNPYELEKLQADWHARIIRPFPPEVKDEDIDKILLNIQNDYNLLEILQSAKTQAGMQGVQTAKNAMITKEDGTTHYVPKQAFTYINYEFEGLEVPASTAQTFFAQNAEHADYGLVSSPIAFAKSVMNLPALMDVKDRKDYEFTFKNKYSDISISNMGEPVHDEKADEYTQKVTYRNSLTGKELTVNTTVKYEPYMHTDKEGEKVAAPEIPTYETSYNDYVKRFGPVPAPASVVAEQAESKAKSEQAAEAAKTAAATADLKQQLQQWLDDGTMRIEYTRTPIEKGVLQSPDAAKMVTNLIAKNSVIGFDLVPEDRQKLQTLLHDAKLDIPALAQKTEAPLVEGVFTLLTPSDTHTTKVALGELRGLLSETTLGDYFKACARHSCTPDKFKKQTAEDKLRTGETGLSKNTARANAPFLWPQPAEETSWLGNNTAIIPLPILGAPQKSQQEADFPGLLSPDHRIPLASPSKIIQIYDGKE